MRIGLGSGTGVDAGVSVEGAGVPGALRLPLRVVGPVALASYGALVFGVLEGWPLWALVVAALLPWAPLFVLDTVRTYRAYPLLALFYVLVVTQTGHFLEHVVQMAQIHALGIPPPQARGVFGALDIEWVHFLWNAWVGVAALALVARYRTNPWLWVTVAIAVWHGVEHSYILSVYLATGVAGTPGFLSRGGLLGGGLPLLRPDLHFAYNLVETAPLVAAFVYQVRDLRRRGRAGAQQGRPGRAADRRAAAAAMSEAPL